MQDEIANRDSKRRVGQLVQIRRMELGLSLREVARRCHSDQGALSRVENGTRLPGPEYLAILAQVLNMPLADLYEAASYPLPSELPSLRPYLRRAYGVPESAIEEIEHYLQQVAARYGGSPGPVNGEDEQP